MIIARSMGPGASGDELLLLGVTRRNIEELIKGHPIRLTTDTHGAGVPLGWTIVIVFGETETSIAADLKRAGGIGPDTKVSALPGGPDHPRPKTS